MRMSFMPEATACRVSTPMRSTAKGSGRRQLHRLAAHRVSPDHNALVRIDQPTDPAASLDDHLELGRDPPEIMDGWHVLFFTAHVQVCHIGQHQQIHAMLVP